MGLYLAGKLGALPKWLPAKAWESFRGDQFVIAADTAIMRREMKPLVEHSPKIVAAALSPILSLCEDTTCLAAGASLNNELAAHAWAAAKDANSSEKVQRTAEAMKTLIQIVLTSARSQAEANQKSGSFVPRELFDAADRLLDNMIFQRAGNDVRMQTAIELDNAKLPALVSTIVAAIQPPNASTKNGIMALVEDFFHHNYRDITSRDARMGTTDEDQGR